MHGSQTSKDKQTIGEPVMTPKQLTAYVQKVFPQAGEYGWTVEGLSSGEISVAMKTDDAHLRPGGTVSGPTMFALADITSYLLILAHIGEVALAVTTNLSINFLTKPPAGDLIGHGRLIKLGKRLAVCEVHIYSRGGEAMVAQATATYSIPPRS